MRIRRRLPLFITVSAIVAAIAIAVVLRKHAPPEPARLLPSAEGYAYIDLTWLRRANLIGNLPPVQHAPEYERFIQATGFQFERDLNQAAFAIHYAPESEAKGSTAEPRFSEVLVGKIDGEKLRAYLGQLSTSVDQYGSADIFNIPLEDRVLRAAILSVDTVAASNSPDPQVIRGIIDRSRKLASPFGGPALLRQYYKDVPLTSLGWAVFQTRSVPNPIISGPLDWSFLFQKPAIVLLSVRYLGNVLFKADAYASDSEEAQGIANRVGTFLSIFRSAQASVQGGPSDQDLQRFLDSLKVEQHDKEAIVTASVPLNLVQKIFAELPKEAASEVPHSQPVESSASKSQKKNSNSRPRQR